MAITVPAFAWPVVFGADLLLITLLVVAVRRHGGHDARRLAIATGAILTSWLALAALISGRGAFVSTPGRPPTIGLGVVVPILIGGAALVFSRTIRAVALAIPQRWLIAVQSMRVLGVLFLVLLGRGVLPAQFALPAGWGDITIGIAAPVVVLALARSTSFARRLAVAWNACGLADLGVAVAMGALSAESPIRLFFDSPSSAAMAKLPLAMIPVFAVPLFVLLHVASLMGLVTSARRQRIVLGTGRELRHA